MDRRKGRDLICLGAFPVYPHHITSHTCLTRGHNKYRHTEHRAQSTGTGTNTHMRTRPARCRRRLPPPPPPNSGLTTPARYAAGQ